MYNSQKNKGGEHNNKSLFSIQDQKDFQNPILLKERTENYYNIKKILQITNTSINEILGEIETISELKIELEEKISSNIRAL